MGQWEVWAHKLLDAQFSDAPNTHAVSMSHPGVTAHGADGCAVHLAEMIKQQRAMMETFVV